MNKGIMRKLYFGFAASGLVYAMGGSSVALAEPPAPCPRAIPSDFDGDCKTDLAVINPSPGPTPQLGQLNWRALLSSGDTSDVKWGLTTEFVVPGDYDGDLKTDQAIYQPSNGQWRIRRSSAGEQRIPFGISTDTPVPADYDRDGKTDIAVVRVGVPDVGGALTWLLYLSSPPFREAREYCTAFWGLPTDIPVPADYDGDGDSDVAIFRPDTGDWWILDQHCVFPFAPPPSPPTTKVLHWGQAGDEAVPGDYDGDDKFDLAVWRPTDRTWYVLRSSDGKVQTFVLGLPSDRRVPGDYDGDGKWDFAVYRPNTSKSPNSSKWIVRHSRTSKIVEQTHGDQTDLPVPSAYTFREPLPRRTGF